MEEPNESNVAKRLRLMGIENDEAIHEEEKVIQKGNFFGNLWYQHKWLLIIVCAFLAMAVVLIVQIAKKEKYDYQIYYTGPQYFDGATMEKINDAFCTLSTDVNHDGKKSINFTDNVYQTDDQIRRGMSESTTLAQLVTASASREHLQDYHSIILTGEIYLFLLDSSVYEQDKEVYTDISDLVEDKTLLYDNGAILLTKTFFASYFEGFETMPENTVLCLRVSSSKVSESEYQQLKDYISALVRFGAE